MAGCPPPATTSVASPRSPPTWRPRSSRRATTRRWPPSPRRRVPRSARRRRPSRCSTRSAGELQWRAAAGAGADATVGPAAAPRCRHRRVRRRHRAVARRRGRAPRPALRRRRRRPHGLRSRRHRRRPDPGRRRPRAGRAVGARPGRRPWRPRAGGPPRRRRRRRAAPRHRPSRDLGRVLLDRGRRRGGAGDRDLATSLRRRAARAPAPDADLTALAASFAELRALGDREQQRGARGSSTTSSSTRGRAAAGEHVSLLPAWSEAFAGDGPGPAPSLDGIEITPAWAYGDGRGAGVRVAIVDSGIDAGHPAVGAVGAVGRGRARPGRGAAGHAGRGRSSRPTCTATAPPARGSCAPSHPVSELWSVRVLGERLTGKGWVFAAAVEWCVEQGAQVVNLSLSTSSDAHRDRFHDIVDRAVHAGVVVVSAMANDRKATYPSQFSGVLSVAATGGARPRGRSCATPARPPSGARPGIDVDVAWLGGSTVTVTGNSFAAPVVSGHAARILAAHPGLSPWQVKTVLAAPRRRTRRRSVGSDGVRAPRGAGRGGPPGGAGVDRGAAGSRAARWCSTRAIPATRSTSSPAGGSRCGPRRRPATSPRWPCSGRATASASRPSSSPRPGARPRSPPSSRARPSPSPGAAFDELRARAPRRRPLPRRLPAAAGARPVDPADRGALPAGRHAGAATAARPRRPVRRRPDPADPGGARLAGRHDAPDGEPGPAGRRRRRRGRARPGAASRSSTATSSGAGRGEVCAPAHSERGRR